MIIWVILSGAAVGMFAFCSLRMLHNEFVRLSDFYFPDKDVPLSEQMFMLASNSAHAAFLLGGIIATATAPVAFMVGLNPAAIAFVALSSIGVPYIAFQRLKQKRITLLEDQFQPSLLLLSNSIRSGQTLTQAISEVTHMTSQPLMQEYKVISREIILGVPLTKALDNFSTRTKIADIKIATIAMIISSRTGADMAKAFEKIAETIRRRKTLKSKINAMTTQGKAQGVVAGLAPIGFGVMFYFIDPVYMQPFLHTTLGNFLIAVVLLLQTCAYFMIRKITDIKI